MSHQPGTYLGGIRTVECLRQRSRIDPITGCWHWGLSLTRGVPILHMVTPDTGRKAKFRGRRAALYLARGSDLPDGHWAFARMCCTSEDCVNPAHSRSGTRKAFGEWLAKSGRIKGGKRSEQSRSVWDKRGRRLTPEMVREIRGSTETTHALAKRMGVSQCAVWLARQGKTHAHVGLAGVKVASVFDWRGSVVMQEAALDHRRIGARRRADQAVSEGAAMSGQPRTAKPAAVAADCELLPIHNVGAK